ncbi:hypothetical protein AOCH_003601 [Aspergillus ochraceoroseus]|uniref:C2H2-type domain-containing protein n=1 Tax=Aspergillus ochraceoroseus TaxID=138278 RepID=A0A0F8V323_9EURO|nr:hypothetical protein AOCH_003601 [Aspergillus ochraceoroseus]
MVIRKCNICDRRFKKTEHFKRHERSHTKEKPYECSVCHKRFSRSDVLSRHAKGHTTNHAISSRAALPSSSLDFLAAPPPPADPRVTGPQPFQGTLFDPEPSDLVQFWLEPRGDTGSHHESLDLMRENAAVSPEQQARPPAEDLSNEPVCDIPNERWARVQRYWLAPSNTTGRLMNSLWQDIACNGLDNIFSSVLENIAARLAKCSMGVENSIGTINTFAAAFLFLNLAAMTGEKEHLEKSQMLYVNLMSVAQRHGLFAATEGQILDITFFETVPDIDSRWKTWSKVESVKRLITGLLLLDSWYSSFLSTSPILVPDSIQLILPCNESLFRASCSMRWTQLVRGGKHLLMPTVLAPSENVAIPSLGSPVEDFCMHGVLAMVQLRLSEAYHRLLSNRASYPFAPCHTYAMDGRARCLPSLQLQIAEKYGEVLDRLNPNAAIMWHNICMALTADIQIFDLAAGRAGPAPARKALDDIAAWSQTPAARRACLHAAHIYKTMTNRKASDHPLFHSIFSLFSAALVLGLYICMVPNSSELRVGGTSIELLDDIDWQRVGTEGFTSFMEPRGTETFAPSDDPAVNFIRNGGTVYFRGVPFQGGSQSARRILLDYAGLLKDAGHWSVRKFSYVLHIMSDVLMEVE